MGAQPHRRGQGALLAEVTTLANRDRTRKKPRAAPAMARAALFAYPAPIAPAKLD